MVEETRDTLGNIASEKLIKPFLSMDNDKLPVLQSPLPADNLTYRYIDSSQTTETYHNNRLIKTFRSINYYDHKQNLQKTILTEHNLIDTTSKYETYYYKHKVCIKIEKSIRNNRKKLIYQKTTVFYPDGVIKYIDEKNRLFPEKSTRTNYQYGSGNFPEKVIILDYKGKPVRITQWVRS